MLNQQFINFRVDDAKMHFQQFFNIPADRSLLHVVRVRYWYAGIKKKTGLTTAYQLEHHFEPLDKTKVDKRTPPRNKWSKYEAGKHKPNSSLARKVNIKVPGSFRELDHPLWEVLRLDERVLPDIDTWMEKLESRVQEVVYKQSHDGVTPLKLRLGYRPALSRSLVKLGNMDALTALLLYWLESKHLEQVNNTRFQARCIYQLLLMMGIDFIDRNMAEEFFVLFLVRVFNCTDWDDRLFGITPAHYVQGTKLLYCLLYSVEDLKPFASWTSRCQAMYRLLEGRKGLDVEFGLGVVLEANWRFGPPTERQWTAWHYEYTNWLWGWTHLNLGSKGRFPDDELWKSLNNSTDTHRGDSHLSSV